MTIQPDDSPDCVWNGPSMMTVAVKAAKAAADLLRENFLLDAGVRSCYDKDIKTAADLAAQEVIASVLIQTGIQILAEEGEHEPDDLAATSWIVDPLDGTLNFTRGFPMAAVSIGLLRDGKPAIGVIVDVFHGDVFSGLVGQGAWLNGKPISVSSTVDSSQAVIATGFPSGRSYDEKNLLEFVSKVRRYKKVRMLGSAALMLAQVASGRFDAYAEDDIYLWDVAAGLALVRAAGGTYRLADGSGPFKHLVSASNGLLDA